MNRFKGALIRFMAGRYGGNDRLNRLLTFVWFAVFVLNLFFKSLSLYLLMLLLMGLLVFRTLSRNVRRRYAENAAYLKLRGKIVNFFSLQKDRFRDRKTHVYRSCPHCRATVRLPRKKGSHSVRCPKCGVSFGVKIR